MVNIISLPDEIIEHILQSIYSTGDEEMLIREIAFLNLVKVLPQWIPILLDARFTNDAGQLGCRYEEIWAYRHLVYLDKESGLWKARDKGWQPHGAKINAWKTRNGDCSHVEIQEEVEPVGRRRGRRSRAKRRGDKTRQQSEMGQPDVQIEGRKGS